LPPYHPLFQDRRTPVPQARVTRQRSMLAGFENVDTPAAISELMNFIISIRFHRALNAGVR
jgi:hypothetical protein